MTVVTIGMLGFLIAISSVRYRTGWALGSALEMPVWLICGFVVSMSSLPAWVRPLSWVLAPTWGMAAIRDSAQGGGNPLANLAMCMGLAACYGVIGTFLARWMVRSARAHATLALS
jgi:ABC-2 type transport system permease protein